MLRVIGSWIAGEQMADLELEGRVDTPDDVHSLDIKLRRVLEGIYEQRDERFAVLLGVGGLGVSHAQSGAFGRVMAEVREEFSSVMARWGSDPATRQIIAIESMRVGHAANLFDSRFAALEFLRKVRRGELIASHRSSRPPPGS